MAFLLVSHGNLTKGMKESVEIIIGYKKNLRYVEVGEDEYVEEFSKKISLEEGSLGEVNKNLK